MKPAKADMSSNKKDKQNRLFNKNMLAMRWIEIFNLGLVSLFNGISTFVGYLMPKLFSSKNSSGTI